MLCSIVCWDIPFSHVCHSAAFPFVSDVRWWPPPPTKKSNTQKYKKTTKKQTTNQMQKNAQTNLKNTTRNYNTNKWNNTTYEKQNWSHIELNQIYFNICLYIWIVSCYTFYINVHNVIEIAINLSCFPLKGFVDISIVGCLEMWGSNSPKRNAW